MRAVDEQLGPVDRLAEAANWIDIAETDDPDDALAKSYALARKHVDAVAAAIREADDRVLASGFART